MLDPMSSTPRRMGPRYPATRRSRRVAPRARSRPGLPPCVRRVRQPGRRDRGDALRPDLADVAATPASSARAARASTPTPPTSAAAPSAPTSPTRTTRSGSRRTSAARREPWQFQPQGEVARRTGSRPTTTASARPARRGRRPAGVRLPQPHRLRHGGAGCALHALALRAGHATRSRPSPTCAGSCRSGAPSATVERQDGTTYTEVVDRRVRPARLGPRRPRPRLVLLGQHRGARRAWSRSTSPTSPS